MGVIGHYSSEKYLKTVFYYSSVCFQKSEMSTGELLWEIENNYNPWLLCFKAPWRMMFNILGLYKNSARMSAVPFVDILMTSLLDVSS